MKLERLGKEKVAADKYAEHLRRKYGLSLSQFEAMLLAQGGKCAICKEPFKSRPNVDHQHDTALVRGLLCSRCNTMIGSIERSPLILDSMLGYLKD